MVTMEYKQKLAHALFNSVVLIDLDCKISSDVEHCTSCQWQLSFLFHLCFIFVVVCSWVHDMLVFVRATIIQHQSARVGHANVGSVALPAVLRAGDANGPAEFTEGFLQKAQHSKLSSQIPNSGHVSPSVSRLAWFSVFLV